MLTRGMQAHYESLGTFRAFLMQEGGEMGALAPARLTYAEAASDASCHPEARVYRRVPGGWEDV